MTVRPIPIPASTKSKGWRFELDLEQIQNSDTWALAGDEARPWLLMLWAKAWLQTPCGSLPAADELIAAQLGMPAKSFAKLKAKLMRGWWLAEDGRLYHDTLVVRANEMLALREKERARKAASRAKGKESVATALGGQTDPSGVPELSHGTEAGQTRESSTRTSTSNTDTEDSHGRAQADLRDPDLRGEAGPDLSGVAPTAAGLVCQALKRQGIARVNPGNLRLQALLTAGATVEEFVAYADKALAAEVNDPFVYLLGVVEGERKRAAEALTQMHQGALPKRLTAAEVRVLDAVPSLAAPHLRPGAPAYNPDPMEAINAAVRRLG